MNRKKMIAEVDRYRSQLAGLISDAIKAGAPKQALDWLSYLAGAEILAHRLGLMPDNLEGRLMLSDLIFESMLQEEGE